jgi:hypothetical protein
MFAAPPLNGSSSRALLVHPPLRFHLEKRQLAIAMMSEPDFVSREASASMVVEQPAIGRVEIHRFIAGGQHVACAGDAIVGDEIREQGLEQPL